MSLALHYGATINATISSSANPSCNCAGASGVLVHILTTSSLTITGQVALDGGASSPDYSTVPITNHKTGAVTAAGTAITVSQDDLYYVPVNGASKLQLVRGAGSGTVSMQPVFAVSGAGSGSSTGPLGIGKAEDAAHASGDVGVMSLGVRRDSLVVGSGTDGDYSTLNIDASGNLYVNADIRTGAGVLALGLRNDGAAYATHGASNGDPTEVATDLQGFVRTALEAITISVSPTIATGAQSAADILFDLTALANAVRVNGGYCFLTGITVFDADNEKAQLDFVFTQANTTALASGGVGAAVDITDANLITDRVIGRATVGSGSYLTVLPAGNAVACETFRPIQMKAGAATTSIYVACIPPNAYNYTANSDLTIDFHFLRA